MEFKRRNNEKSFLLYSCFFLTISVCGCNSLEIEGIENFNENNCALGLCDDLLPGDSDFLINYPYEDGSYHYYCNGYPYDTIKTFVRLQYSDSFYQEAKSACEYSYNFSGKQYYYDDYVFCVGHFAKTDAPLNLEFPGIQMIGYDDETYTLIFVGYLTNESIDSEPVTTANFAEFFSKEFGEYLKTEEKVQA